LQGKAKALDRYGQLFAGIFNKKAVYLNIIPQGRKPIKTH
jgi:hypothetical protein